jgi:phosphotransferase system HPr (HPr) family protein
MVERAIQVDPSFEAESAAKLVQTASRFKSRVSLVSEERTANAKSIMGIISLDLHGGTTVKIVAEGEDEQEAVPEIEFILGEKR